MQQYSATPLFDFDFQVTRALQDSFHQVNWVLLMMLILNFAFMLVAMLLFGENDPQHFGTFSMAATAIWMVETMDDWDVLMYTNILGCAHYGYFDIHGFSTTARPCNSSKAMGWYAAIFFVLVVVLGGFVMPTVLIGVISIAFEKSSKKIAIEMQHDTRVEHVIKSARIVAAKHGSSIVNDQQIVDLRAVFDFITAHPDHYSASLHVDELIPFLSYFCESYLTPILEEDLAKMVAVIDESGDGDVSW